MSASDAPQTNAETSPPPSGAQTHFESGNAFMQAGPTPLYWATCLNASGNRDAQLWSDRSSK